MQCNSSSKALIRLREKNLASYVQSISGSMFWHDSGHLFLSLNFSFAKCHIINFYASCCGLIQASSPVNVFCFLASYFCIVFNFLFIYTGAGLHCDEFQLSFLYTRLFIRQSSLHLNMVLAKFAKVSEDQESDITAQSKPASLGGYCRYQSIQYRSTQEYSLNICRLILINCGGGKQRHEGRP